jgi:hypothetical protein
MMRANRKTRETATYVSLYSPAMSMAGVSVHCVPYPWVPKELSEHHQVSRGEGEAHVGSSNGQYCH